MKLHAPAQGRIPHDARRRRARFHSKARGQKKVPPPSSVQSPETRRAGVPKSNRKPFHDGNDGAGLVSLMLFFQWFALLLVLHDRPCVSPPQELLAGVSDAESRSNS